MAQQLQQARFLNVHEYQARDLHLDRIVQACDGRLLTQMLLHMYPKPTHLIFLQGAELMSNFRNQCGTGRCNQVIG